MNAPVRITHELLKAVTTAAAHQASNLNLTSPYSRANFAYRGLLNTSFSYGGFMAHESDEPVSTFDNLPQHQFKFITEGYDIDPAIVKETYDIALKMVDLRRSIYKQDYLLPLGRTTELPVFEPLKESPVNELPIIEPETTESPAIESVVKSKVENKDKAEEWLKSPSVAKLPNMTKNIAKGLDDKGIETYADLAKLKLSELVEMVRGIGGGTFHMKKCEGWLKVAKEHGETLQ